MRSINLSFAFVSVAVASLVAAPAARLSKRHQEWLNGPVSLLITKVERQAFQHLQTDEERDRYIDRFWEARNPAPNSGQNEFKDEFYRRLDYANAHFGRYSGSEGWRTDMGKTYILFGRPQTSTNYTANQELHPIELWFYGNPGLAELPPFFYVLFYEKDDITGYRFYQPYIDSPNKLMRDDSATKGQAYQYLRNISPELARASLSLIPGEPVDTDSYSGSMESVSVMNAIQGFREMPSYVSVVMARAARLERVTSRIDYDVARTALATFVVRDLGDPWVHWQLSIEDPLQPKVKDGRVQYDISARLYSHGRLVFERTDSPRFNAPAGDANALKRRPFAYEDRMPVVPGDYRLTVSAKSHATGKVYEATKEIAVPAAGAQPLLSDILVFGQTEPDSRPRAFQFAGVKFRIAPGSRIRAAAGLHVLYQFTAPDPQAPAYDVEYVVGSVASSYRKTFEDKLDMGRAAAGSLLTAKTLGLEDISPGTYQLAVRIKDPQTGRLTAASVGFSVLGAQDDPAPIVVSRGGTDTPQWIAVNQYERALCWLAQDRPSEAVTSLEASWKLNQNPVTKGLLQHLYERTGQKSRTLD